MKHITKRFILLSALVSMAIAPIFSLKQGISALAAFDYTPYLCGNENGQDKVQFCHAAGQSDTDQFVTLCDSVNAVINPGNAGHFDENGTPRAGHEQDYFGACRTPTVTDNPTVTPTVTEIPVITDTPTVTPTITQTPIITETPVLADTPTVTPTQMPSTPSNTNTPVPAATNTPAPAATSTPEAYVGGGEDNPVTSGIVRTSDVLGSEINYNPLIEGIKETFNGQVLSTSTLANTASVDFTSTKNPTNNKLIEDSYLLIPAINLNQPVYQGVTIGNDYLVGQQEVLKTNIDDITLFYAHNANDVFGQLFQLKNGDNVTFIDGDHLQTLSVVDKFYVSADTSLDTLFLNGSKTLLMTCSFANPNNRIIVVLQ